MMTAVFTGCGADRDYDRDDSGYYDTHDYDNRSDRDDTRDENSMTGTGSNNTVEDHLHDAIDGVENAGEELVDGVGDAAGDIVDGLDGDRETSSTTRTTKKR